MQSRLPIQLFVSTPSGPLPLTPERGRLSLPQGADSRGAALSYGPYLQAIARFLTQNAGSIVTHCLSRHMGRPVSWKEIERLDIISEKHGALYHVVHLLMHLPGETASFALNVAVSPEQQAFLATEVQLLTMLHEHFSHPHLPRVYCKGETLYAAEYGLEQTLTLFVAEWFEGYHEFHLAGDPRKELPVIKVWGLEKGDTILNASDMHALYRQASAILTDYLDPHSFRQIYPWHHAAGDFILRQNPDGIQLKLITARDYRALMSPGPDPDERWLALCHFFFNLTLRMRLDRLEGTGELAWASPQSLHGIIAGFAESWARKARHEASLPPPEEVLSFMHQFTTREWLSLGEAVLEDGMVEAEEAPFLKQHLGKHICNLMEALQTCFP